MGKEVRRWEEREIIYLSQHCHPQNDSSIKMGGDESRFSVSLTVRDKVTRQRIRTEAPLLTSLTPYRSAQPAY